MVDPRHRGQIPAQGRRLALPDDHGATVKFPAERHPGVPGEVPQAGAQGENAALGPQDSSVHRRGREQVHARVPDHTGGDSDIAVTSAGKAGKHSWSCVPVDSTGLPQHGRERFAPAFDRPILRLKSTGSGRSSAPARAIRMLPKSYRLQHILTVAFRFNGFRRKSARTKQDVEKSLAVSLTHSRKQP